MMHRISLSRCIIILIACLLFTLAADTTPNGALDGKRWLGETYSNFVELTISADSVPYKSSRFSYVFRVESGQKLIRLHFKPTLYDDLKKADDLFSVEAGPFTLLSNFSVVGFVTKEFCIVIEENDLLNVTVSGTHGFVERIEVVSVPETVLYCHAGERGVQVVGEKFLVYVDSSTALEVVHRENVKRDFVSSGDDYRGVFGMWGEVFNRKGNEDRLTWRVSVDVGFRYLVRLHFSELGVKMTDNVDISFSIAINGMVVCTNEDIFVKLEDKNGLYYKNFVVMAKGWMLEGKRDIIISLESREEFMEKDGPLEGFEIFKLSNHDNSLVSPNPFPPATDSTYWTFQNPHSIFDSKSIVSALAVIVISLLNIIVHMLRNCWEANFPEEEKRPATVVNRICRCFSLMEIREATKNFSEVRVIGKGGFGKVYKGFIDNGPEIVAVKRLKPDSKQGKHEFWAEVETLSELRHVNLVSLIGYCNEQEEMILVYDYMPNGSLADHLYKLARKNSKCSPLSWDERLEICIGAGRGLDYLHTGKGVLHRDVKASNILLDATFVAKVSDFGLATTENVWGLQNQDTTILKGTFGYIDPDYFKTRKLTMKSDTYAFGVLLLEVLCGRPAVDPLAGEDGRSLTNWARDKITRGKVDEILAPSLSGGISPDSLKAFLWIVERCLHDEPNKRPTIAHVVTNLEFALDQQNGVTGFADFVPFTGQLQQSRYLVPNELTNVTAQLENNVTSLLPLNTGSADCMPFSAQLQQSRLLVPNDLPDVAAQLEINATSLLTNEITGFTDAMPHNERKSMLLTTASFHPQNEISLSKDQSKSRMFSDKTLKDGRRNIKQRLTRLFLFDSIWRKAKAPQKPDVAIISVSAPMLKNTGEKESSTSNSTVQNKKSTTEGGIDELLSNPNFRIFSFTELKIATRNFRPDNVLGEGGFGSVFKGFLKDESTNNNASGRIIAVKRLNDNSIQGLKEWLSEITFLGKLSHPNLVKLLGVCLEDDELLLVYEFMVKGSLETRLFRRSPIGDAVEALSWDVRLKILTGAARGLEYLHTLDDPIIYRDFKTSNILLDESYNAKLSDFGLAKSGPSPEHTHVSTRVMGTDGYAAPEYVATGHLTVKSDVYGFGVVLLEMLTGQRAIDKSRPQGQQFLVSWISKHFNRKKKLMSFVDSRLEENYPPKSVFQVYRLAENCVKYEYGSRPSMSEVVKILEDLDKSPRKARIHNHALINAGLEKELAVEEEGIHVPNMLKAEDIAAWLEKELVLSAEEEGIHVPNLLKAGDNAAWQGTVEGSLSGNEKDETSGQQMINGVNEGGTVEGSISGNVKDETSGQQMINVNERIDENKAEVVRWWWE